MVAAFAVRFDGGAQQRFFCRTHNKDICLMCILQQAHDKLSLPCVGVRQTFFLQLFLIHKNYETSLKTSKN
jgi:hypothetical protein